MKALVWPVATYGCESWTLRKNKETRLDAFEMKGLRKKEGTVRHRQSKEASILWSHHEETRELPGERDNTRNNARCTQASKGHARPGWTTSKRGQNSPWKSQSE